MTILKSTKENVRDGWEENIAEVLSQGNIDSQVVDEFLDDSDLEKYEW